MTTGVLPLQIYRESLEYLSPIELKSSALTSRAFHTITQRLMFQDLWVNFWPGGEPITTASRDTTLARLAFYASDRIAHAVKTCEITSYLEAGDQETVLLSQEIVIAALQAFRHFNNLRRVCVWRIRDSNRLEIEWNTRMNAPALMDALLASVSVAHQFDSQGEYDTQVVAQLPLLCRDATRLFIGWDEEIGDAFIHSLLSLAPFQSLRKLKIAPTYAEQASLFEALLSACPALEALTILWNFQYLGLTEEVVMLAPAPDAVPRLTFYEGPDDMINAFMAGRPVRHLAAPGTAARVQGQYLLRGLENVVEYERVVSLDLRVHNLTGDFLKRVCELFPNLRALAIWAKEYEPKDAEVEECNSEDIYAALCAPGEHLQNVEFLTICLENEYAILECVSGGKGNYVESVAIGECGMLFVPGLLSGEGDDDRPDVDYTIGPDGAFWDINSPIFPMFDWEKVRTLEGFKSLQYLEVRSMNYPRRFSFVADRRQTQEGVYNIGEWREVFGNDIA